MGMARQSYLRLIGRDARAAAIVVAVSVGLGLLINALRPQPLTLVPEPPEVMLARSVGEVVVLESAEPPLVEIERAMEVLDKGAAIFVDAREPAFYELGHVPGAVSLPRAGFKEAYPAFAKRAGKDQPLMVYCSESSCVDSLMVAKALMRLGYAQVEVFHGGWDEWEAAGQPQEP